MVNNNKIYIIRGQQTNKILWVDSIVMYNINIFEKWTQEIDKSGILNQWSVLEIKLINSRKDIFAINIRIKEKQSSFLLVVYFHFFKNNIFKAYLRDYYNQNNSKCLEKFDFCFFFVDLKKVLFHFCY